ncbi:MAG: RpiB/LacA/LacB family sugar-phosphate isomerase [Patescibacteria group bacterium]
MAKSPFTIHVATDHAGFEHKECVKEWLQNEGYVVHDHGACSHDPLDDYPDFISLAAAAVSKAPESKRAVVFGGSGQGEAMLANRYPNVRATVYYGGTDEVISLSREHNAANVLSIGARFVSKDDTLKVIWDWLHTEQHPDEKYERRIKKAEKITKDLR